MIRFRFNLRPLADIEPWGGKNPTLHWFALTDGWYWIDLGGQELLRYSDRVLQRWAARQGGERTLPYVDYYVVRLWEDVIDMVPEVTEPVPEDLVDFVAGDLFWASRENSPQAEAAGMWHSGHSMDMGYLRSAPRIRWWRTITNGEDRVTVAWQHRPDAEIEFAGPQEGRVTVPIGEFVTAVTEFDRSLLTAMDQRIFELEAAGPPPGADVDLPRLRHEHQIRSARLRSSWARECHTDWDVVRAGARELRAAGAHLGACTCGLRTAAAPALPTLPQSSELAFECPGQPAIVCFSLMLVRIWCAVYAWGGRLWRLSCRGRWCRS